tara:strand:+ start:629 stop:928 length:300 start_codon:yes stop_codon:yes gene_type:complete
MTVMTEEKLRSIVKNYLVENGLVKEDEEMTDELNKIIAKLGVGKDVNKSLLAAAMKAGTARNAKQNKVVADLFMSILDQPDMITKIIPLLKKAAEESEA